MKFIKLSLILEKKTDENIELVDPKCPTYLCPDKITNITPGSKFSIVHLIDRYIYVKETFAEIQSEIKKARDF